MRRYKIFISGARLEVLHVLYGVGPQLHIFLGGAAKHGAGRVWIKKSKSEVVKVGA